MRKNRIIDIIFFLGLFCFFLIPAVDPDLGWQLRCGQEMLSDVHRTNFCSVNNFSVLLPGYSWPNLYWLYQVILWLIYQAAGLWGLTILNGLVMGSCFWIFYRGLSGERWLRMVLTGIIIFFSWHVLSLGIRSQEMGLLFFVLLLRWPKMAPLILLFWTNTHGSFILGLVLLPFLLFSSGASSTTTKISRQQNRKIVHGTKVSSMNIGQHFLSAS
ncbi:MAG: hypothetical protein Q8N98_01500 [bacterium]|nr:hypothetical protein [bacterium]